MLAVLLSCSLLADPQNTLREPPQNALDPFIVQHDGETVNIFGPWHNSRTVYYATLSRPTRQQIEAALAQARRTWEAQRAVKPMAIPFESSNADGSDTASGQRLIRFPLLERLLRQ